MKSLNRFVQTLSGVDEEESLFLWEFHSATYIRQLIVVAMLAISSIWNVVTQVAQDSLIPPLIAFAVIKLIMVLALIAKAILFGRHLHKRGGLRFTVRQTYRRQMGLVSRQHSTEMDTSPFRTDPVMAYCGVLSDWFWLFWLTVGLVLDIARVWVQCVWSEAVSSRVGACIGYNTPNVIPVGPAMSAVFYALLAPLVVASVKGTVWVVSLSFALIAAQWGTLYEGQGTRGEHINLARLWLILIMVYISLFTVAISVPWSAQIAFRARRLAEKRYFDLKRAVEEGREARAAAKADEAKARAETAAQVAERTLAYTFHTLRNPLHSLLAGLTDLTEETGPVGHEARVREAAALAALPVSAVPFHNTLAILNDELQSMKDTVELMNHRVEQAGRHTALLSGAVYAKMEATNVREWLRGTVATEAGEHSAVKLAVSVHSSVPETATLDRALTAELLHHAIENAVAAVRTAWGQAPDSAEKNGLLPLPAELALALRTQGLPEAHVSVIARMQSVSPPYKSPGGSNTSGSQERKSGVADRAEGRGTPVRSPLEATACLVLQVVNVGTGLPPYVSIDRLLSPFRKPVHDTFMAASDDADQSNQSVREPGEPEVRNVKTRIAVRTMGLGLSLCKLLCKLLGGRLALSDDANAVLPAVAIKKQETGRSVRNLLLDPPSRDSPAFQWKDTDMEEHEGGDELETTEVPFKLTRFQLTLPLLPQLSEGTARVSPREDGTGHDGAFQIEIITPRADLHTGTEGSGQTTVVLQNPSTVQTAVQVQLPAAQLSIQPLPSFAHSLSVQTGTTTAAGGQTPASGIPQHLRDISRQPLRSTTASERSGTTASTMSPYTRAQPLAGIRLLVVDDEASVRKATAKMLGRAGALVSLATDGDEVLSMLRAASEVERPFDAVLLDIIMRRMNGEEACLLARAAGYTDLPILAASGNTGPADVAEYLANGFTGILGKPFTLRDAVQALQKAGVSALPGRLRQPYV